MGSRAFSHDSIFISEVSEEDGSSVRVMSEESTSGKVKSIQRQIAHNIKFGHKPVSTAVRKVEEFGDSSEDEEHPRCVIQVVADVEVNPSDTLTKSTDYPKASSSNEENNWNNGDKKGALLRSPKPKRALSVGGTIESINLDAVPFSVSRLDNAAAKHKLSVKPKNQRISKKHRRLTLDLQDLTHSDEHQDKDTFRKNIGIKSKEEGDVLSASIEQNKIPNEQMFKEFQNERKRIEDHDKLQEHLHYNQSKGDQEQMQKDKLLHENVMQKDYETAIQTSKISEERKKAVAENMLYEGKPTDEKENEDQRQLEWEKPKKRMTEEQRSQNFEEQRCVVAEQRRRQNEQSQHVLEKTKKLETKEWKQMEEQGLYDIELKKMETKERQHNHLQEQKQHLLIEHKEKKEEGYNENVQMLKDGEQQQKWEQRKQLLDIQRHQEMEEDQLKKADQQMKKEFEKQRRQEAEEETQQDLAEERQDVENQRKLKVEEQRQQEIEEQKKKEQKMQEAEEHKKKEIKEQKRQEVELQIKREIDNQRQQDFEEKKKKEAEEKNKKELEEQRQQDLEEKRKREAEEQQKREMEHQRDLEKQKKREDEEKKKELEKQRKLDLEAIRKREAEEKRQRELEEKRMQEAEELKQRELEEQRQRELKEQRKQEAEKLKKLELEEQRRQDKEVQRIQEVEKQMQIENEKQRQQDLQEQLINEPQLKILDEKKRQEAEVQKQWNVRSKCQLVAKEQMNFKAEKGRSDEAEEIMQEWEKEQNESNANQTELEFEDNQRFDPQEQERRREELRWQDMEERHAAPRPFTFKVSSGEKQIIFQKVNLTPVTPVNHHSNQLDQKESKSLSGAKGAHSLPSSLYIPHTAILVTGAQLCGTAVNMDQIKDTACKSLLGLSEDKKTLDLPPVNSRSKMSPEGKPSTIKSRSLHEGNQSSAAILAEWAMIRSRILKSADNGKLHERDSRYQVRHATEDCSQKGVTNPHTSLRKTVSASAKFSITPAWQKFPDSPKTISNEPSKPRLQNERDATKTRTLSLDLDSADSSPCKAKERSIQVPKSTKTPDSTEGYVFAKDLPSFLVPSPPHGSQKGRSPSETQIPQENHESTEKRVLSSEEKVSPFGIKLRRTNYSLRYHSEQQAEQKRKKRYSAGDNFEGIPAPLLPIGHEKSTLSNKGTAAGSLKDTKDNNATGSVQSLPEARLTPSKMNIPAIHGESERHLLKPTAYQKPCLAPKPSCATPPSSPLDKSEKSKIVESQRTVKEGLAPLKKKDDVKEDTLPVSSQRSQNEEEEAKEKKSFFPSINIPWRERVDRKTELIKREKPTLQSRHSLDSSRLPEKGESSQPLWITLALQKQRGFREQQSTREERRQAREAKLAEKQAKENNGNGSLAEKKASSDQAPQKPTTQTEEKKPESLLSRFERREQLRKSNTLPNSVTVEIADSSAPSPKEVPKRFPPSESAQVATEPAWLALAKRKAKAWSDCPQIIK
ncbi:capping protein inhibiting regulator of actin dynamics [Polypterus senegalus]|uniref:capping protein inhibiting regulator of actin dynamics n=1 Tax=Polypterus senegalus TaxID=55291 RepID=UPI001962A3E2|nr:capping protein inhibiting regulator of actin dynamics [Polypterus senegalus]XP_039606825.1 capping protein inhibiting regulator of actin dynamics [Polypterus senegalus]